jgi:hypothetical protein
MTSSKNENDEELVQNINLKTWWDEMTWKVKA